MEVVILEEKKNPFFNRKELSLLLKHFAKATPSKNELIKFLSEKYKVDPTQVKIDYIFSKKGISESFAKVKILEEKPVQDRVEDKQKDKGEINETQTS